MNKFFGILLLLFLIACSPKVITKSLDATMPSRINLDYEPFGIIEKDTIDRSVEQKIGQIEIKDAGLTLNCDFATVKRLAKIEALKIGGNCLVITEHKKPNQWSTCHRIKADVFLIDNARDYESEIIWNANRKLEISDFKASIEKRPFIAATASIFRYRIEGKPVLPKRYKVIVETYFDCYSSYFKPTEFDSEVLSHEQIHFDISELYARKFIARIEKEDKDLNELVVEQEIIVNEVARALQKKQDEYDSEVYADRSKQSVWSNWIKEELSKYDQYAKKVLVVNQQND